MNIKKELDTNSAKFLISGHIDTTTAPEVEAAVNELGAEVKKLVFDFTDVEYISSAGLRVLLQTHKSMVAKGGELVIENVTEDVKSILEMTGFLGFLNVK